ncbi:MAG: NAD-dependent epimerase/dehydratase family protein [Planctomycetes bacterium]|nr:NAD-dependent epimerase/dehydratase family protein [Planctomycetota bacterium]
MSGLRVLVTAATSSLGRAFCQELYGDQLRVDHVFAVAHEEVVPYYFRDYHPDRFTYWSANLLKERALKDLFLAERFRRRGIDQIVHFGFLRTIKALRLSPADATEGTRRLLEFAQAAKVDHFVYASGCLVYRLRPWTSAVIDETAELDFDPGADAWIKSRVDTDMVCRTFMDQRAPRITVLRPGPIIGRNVTSHVSDLLDSYLVTRLAGYDPMMRPIHSTDVRRAIHRCLDARPHGVFNVAGPDIAPLSTFCRLNGRPQMTLPGPLLRPVNRLQRLFGLSACDLSTLPRWLMYPCVLDTTKLEEAVGHRSTHHIKFGEA